MEEDVDEVSELSGTSVVSVVDVDGVDCDDVVDSFAPLPDCASEFPLFTHPENEAASAAAATSAAKFL